MTNGGEVTAILVPPATSKLEVLRLAGKVTTPRNRSRGEPTGAATVRGEVSS